MKKLMDYCEMTSVKEVSHTVHLEKLPRDYKKMRYFQNIGDTWSARKIGDALMDDKELVDNPILLKSMAFNYSGLSDPLAAKSIIERVIDKKVTSAEGNENLVSAQYLLALLYSRHLPKQFKSLLKSKKILNEAYSTCLNEEIPMSNRDFERIFNRNGYALLLFFEGHFNETIDLMKKLIRELRPLITENGFAKLHYAVLNFNIFQVYLRAGMLEQAENQLNLLIRLDPNDVEYRYTAVRFFIENKRFEEALEVLKEIKASGSEDIVYQSSYEAQCLIELEEYEKALPLTRTAVCYNIEPEVKNLFLYNYLVCVINLNMPVDKNFVNRFIEQDEIYENQVRELCQ